MPSNSTNKMTTLSATMQQRINDVFGSKVTFDQPHSLKLEISLKRHVTPGGFWLFFTVVEARDPENKIVRYHIRSKENNVVPYTTHSGDIPKEAIVNWAKERCQEFLQEQMKGKFEGLQAWQGFHTQLVSKRELFMNYPCIHDSSIQLKQYGNLMDLVENKIQVHQDNQNMPCMALKYLQEDDAGLHFEIYLDEVRRPFRKDFILTLRIVIKVRVHYSYEFLKLYVKATLPTPDGAVVVETFTFEEFVRMLQTNAWSIT